MSVLGAYRKQHGEILVILKDIAALLDGGATAADAARFRGLLSSLSGILTIHLAMEDGSLYPALGHSKSPEVRTTAQRYASEMKGITGAFRALLERWPTVRSIRESPDSFAVEMKRVVDALTRRIGYEDRELYPLLEQHG